MLISLVRQINYHKFAQLHFLVIEADVPFLLQCLPQLQMELTLSNAETLKKSENARIPTVLFFNWRNILMITKCNNFKLT